MSSTRLRSLAPYLGPNRPVLPTFLVLANSMSPVVGYATSTIESGVGESRSRPPISLMKISIRR